MSPNPKIDTYLNKGCGRCPLGGTPGCKVHAWTEELKALRTLVLECGLTEELKWGVPCYTFQDKNIVIVSAFKAYCALSFFKGTLLRDKHGILKKHGESSQAVGFIQFVSVQEIEEKEAILKAYIQEAMEVEKAGLVVHFKKKPEPIPEELEQMLNEDPYLKSAFENLTPGRQRGYILFISQPKQSETRRARIIKCIPKIMNGEGLNDKYKSRKK